MWSGPRPVPPGLLGAWENRRDTVVTDEPLYAFYLTATGLDHPGRDEVIASQPQDWRVVLRELTTGPLPSGVTIYYQKHMTHHLLPSVDRSALAGLRHAFLIRDPRSLLACYARACGRRTGTTTCAGRRASCPSRVRCPRPASTRHWSRCSTSACLITRNSEKIS